MKCIHIIISGKVHGVFFRQTAKELAFKLGIKGYVRNTADGRVEIVAEGEEKQLKELIEFCKRGPERAIVNDVNIEYIKGNNKFRNFEIKFS